MRSDNYIRYYSAYVQDDYRVNDRLSVDYGIRLEHETGLAERNNQLVVGFDREAISPLNVTIPAGLDPLHPEARQVQGRTPVRGRQRRPNTARESAEGEVLAAGGRGVQGQ